MSNSDIELRLVGFEAINESRHVESRRNRHYNSPISIKGQMTDGMLNCDHLDLETR